MPAASTVRWQTALAHAPGLLRKLLAAEWLPSCGDEHQLPRPRARRGGGHAWSPCRAGAIRACSQIDERHDTWGNPYYWLAFERRRSSAAEGTDLAAVYAGYISVTPLFLDLTHQAMREVLRRALA